MSLGAFGVEMNRKSYGINASRYIPSSIERLEKTAKLGFSPRVIFDGGAYKGRWATAVANVFPDARLVLIEPNSYLRSAIESNISSMRPPPVLLDVALGATQGEASLNIWGDPHQAAGASVLDHVQGEAERQISVHVDTLDGISRELGLSPDLVKLDLQGGELLALQGGTHALHSAELWVIEFSCLEAYMDRTTPKHLMEIMYDNNYRLYDIVDYHYRPYDGALTGGDFFFAKVDSILCSYKDWC